MENQKLWANERRTRATKILDRLLSICTPQGFPSSYQLDFDFRALDALARPHGTVKASAMWAIERMKAESLSSMEDFEAKYAARQHEVEQNAIAETRPWSVYIPLSLRPKGFRYPVSLKLLGQTVTLRTWDAIIKRFTANALDILLKRYFSISFEPAPTCLQITVDAHSPEILWSKTEPVFDAFRGLLEMTMGFGTSTWMSRPRARRSVAHPEWLFAFDGRREVIPFRFFVKNEESSQNIELPLQRFDSLKRLGRRLQDQPERGSTRRMLVEVLRLYSQVMDAPENHLCFLALWQLAEAMTLAAAHNGSKNVVCHRLAWLLRQSVKMEHDGIQEILELLYDKRCRIVHDGIRGDIDDEEINFMKFVCEMSIRWLLWMMHRVKTTAEFESVLKWGQCHSKDLDAFASAIRFLNRTRENAERRPAKTSRKASS